MMKNAQEKLTLEERLGLAAKSQAASPETAARLVEKLSQLHTGKIFCGGGAVELMYGLIGPYMDQMGDDLLYYSGFCRSINLAFADNATQAEAGAPFQPFLGTRASNTVVLLGLMLLDHAKGRVKNKEVYHCTRMTLGQYLEALETLAFPEDEAPHRQFRGWREQFLNFYAPSAPLADVLADLLQQYIQGWKIFDYLNYVLRCMEKFSSCLEREEPADLNSRYMDLLNAYSWDLPDLAGEGISVGDVRAEIFLPDWDFSPTSLRAMAGEVTSSEFREAWDQLILEQNLSAGMSRVNSAVSNLFMLLVGPYLCIGKNHAPLAL